MPRGVKGSIDVLWPPCDFSLALGTFPCHAPLAFGQRQMLSLSDYFMIFKGFKAFNLFLRPFTDVRVEACAQLGSPWGEKR